MALGRPPRPLPARIPPAALVTTGEGVFGIVARALFAATIPDVGGSGTQATPPPAPVAAPPPPPAAGDNQTQMAQLLAKMTETCGAITARLDVNGADIATLATQRTAAAAKKTNWEKRWSMFSRQAMQHAMARYGPDEYDANGDSRHGQVRLEPTPNLSAIVEAASWDQAHQYLVTGVSQQSNIHLNISLATAGALRDGNIIPVQGFVSQSWSLFCFAPQHRKRSRAAAAAAAAISSQQAATARHIASSQQAGLSDKQINVVSKATFGAAMDWEEARETCENLAAVYRFITSVYKEGRNNRELISQGKLHAIFMECIQFFDTSGHLLDPLLESDPLAPMRYPGDARGCHPRVFVRRFRGTLVGGSHRRVH